MTDSVGSTLSPDVFRALFPGASRLCIAYSGGRDSHVLLALAATRFRQSDVALDAVHINHQLQPDADKWAAHCANTCTLLGVRLKTIAVSVTGARRLGPEAAAREARYAAFESVMTPGAVLAQAHHAEDQAETVLLRLLRGTGVHGVRGMPDRRDLGNGSLWRPLLGESADALARCATDMRLSWVEDPSNADLRFDRNYLRQKVMPVVRARWPDAARAVGDTARHVIDATSVLDKLLDAQLAAHRVGDGLGCAAVRLRPRQESVLLLHRWCRLSLGHAPTGDQLERALDEVVNADADAQPSLKIGRVQLRRHRDTLHLVEPTPAVDPDLLLDWPSPHPPLTLPDGRVLSRDTVLADGLATVHLDAGWQVGFRRGGESIKLAGRPRAPLKKVLNALGVPPWERAHRPLLYIDGQLAWVCGVGTDIRFRGASGGVG